MASPTNPTPPPATAAVSVRNVQRAFGTRQVLGGIDLDIQRGEFVALLGASGCGKSTLLRVLAALDPQATGALTLPARKSVVFQEPRLLPWKRVSQNVSLGLGGSRRENRQRALASLEEVGLGGRADAWPLTLSGGEAQRVALARALVREPELLLLDEPFGALDALTRIRMHGLLAELWQRHRPAVLLVTHDVDEALLLADRAIVLSTPEAPPRSAADASERVGGNQLVADLTLDIPSPRRRTHPRFVALRQSLLSQLGVVEEAGEGDLEAGVAAEELMKRQRPSGTVAPLRPHLAAPEARLQAAGRGRPV
jgi:sulfonate transport system ATP-binding protein